MKKNKIPQHLKIWIDVRQRYHLSHAHVQMARELGLNPRKFGGLANHRQEPWKLPLSQFIEALYLKRFRKSVPDEVLSIEERSRRIAAKRAQRKARAESPQTGDVAEPQEYSDEIPF
jgi:hypothetical protein